MGRKINPRGFRLAVNRDWSSQWYARQREFSDCLIEDYNIRKHIHANHASAQISRINIERSDSTAGARVRIYVARVGALIGTKGEDIEKLRVKLRHITGKQDTFVEVMEVRNAESDAALVAQSIASRLEKRQRSRRVIQSTLQSVARQSDVLGVKIRVKGRLEGADIARKDYRHEGRVPLHTLRADIDYGFAEATTQMGQIGVKVWVFRGERLSRDDGFGKKEEDGPELPSSESGLEALQAKLPTGRRPAGDVPAVPSDEEQLRQVSQEFEDGEE